MHVKEIAKQLIDTLPDESTLDDIMHAPYIGAKFGHGEDLIRQGKGIPHEQVKRELRKWLK
jgi:hypothetical protein